MPDWQHSSEHRPGGRASEENAKKKIYLPSSITPFGAAL